MPSLFDILSGGRFGSNDDLQAAAVDLVNQSSIGRGGSLGAGLSGLGQDLKQRPDLAKHALMSQAISDKFGPTVARGAGLAKEGIDFFGQIFGGAGPDQSDLEANEIGIGNSQGSFNNFLEDLFGRSGTGKTQYAQKPVGFIRG